MVSMIEGVWLEKAQRTTAAVLRCMGMLGLVIAVWHTVQMLIVYSSMTRQMSKLQPALGKLSESLPDASQPILQMVLIDILAVGICVVVIFFAHGLARLAWAAEESGPRNTMGYSPDAPPPFDRQARGS